MPFKPLYCFIFFQEDGLVTPASLEAALGYLYEKEGNKFVFVVGNLREILRVVWFTTFGSLRAVNVSSEIFL